ncbi:hypothetical protein ACIB24_20945 [Spongisporangium articulatum]|uniref:PH domain-containing protein n=1 Tax=Spongisporangium articulatum TaxID=3362603 RepID=A0ABW8AT25_9ACTN
MTGGDTAGRGRLLLTERLWPSGTALLVLASAVMAVVLVAAAQAGAGAAWGVLAFMTATLAVLLPFFVVENSFYERELVTRAAPFWPPLVVPWAVVDPSQVRLHRRANLLGRRWSTREARFQTAPWTTIAVSFPGPAPRRRRASSSATTEAMDRMRAELAAWNLTGAAGEIRWVIGTRRPDLALEAIEAALTAAGRAGSRGLAARELADPSVERWDRPAGH